MKHLIRISTSTLFALLTAAALAQVPTVAISDQAAAGHSVTIDRAVLAEEGFVVIHAFDLAGELVLTPPLGKVMLAAGTHDDLMIELDAELLVRYGYGMTAKALMPMVHVDGNDNGTYEFPDGPDVPVMVADQMVIATAMVSFSGLADAASAQAFTAELSGAQEVPPVMTPATGSVAVTLEGDTLRVYGDFSGLSSPLFEIADSPAHVHAAAPGENGGVVFIVNVTAAMDNRSGLFTLVTELSAEERMDFLAGRYYLNIHTEDHQGGELRAQLSPMGMSGMSLVPTTTAEHKH